MKTMRRFRYGPFGSHTKRFAKATRDKVLGLIQKTKGYVTIREQERSQTGRDWEEWTTIRVISEREGS